MVLCFFCKYKLFNGPGHPILFVGFGVVFGSLPDTGHGVLHGNGLAEFRSEHGGVVVTVSQRHHIVQRNSS